MGKKRIVYRGTDGGKYAAKTYKKQGLTAKQNFHTYVGQGLVASYKKGAVGGKQRCIAGFRKGKGKRCNFKKAKAPGMKLDGTPDRRFKANKG